jgi:hypothetical protein
MLTAEQAWRLLLTPVRHVACVADDWDAMMRDALRQVPREPPLYFWLGADAERA